MSIDAKKASDLLQAGLAIGELGMSVAQGKLPNPAEVAKAMSAVMVALPGVDVDDLKDYLDDAARRRLERLAELAAAEKMGPRP